MEIRRRIGLPKTCFHVMNRGARRINIFSNDEERGIFVSLMGKYALKHGIRLLSWCLMPNHYHLQPDSEGTPLSRMMHDLDGTYARIFNQRHRGSGCLFQGPYRSVPIHDTGSLAYVSRYIHTNPTEIGRVPETYPWSSCGSYLGTAPVPEWLDRTPVLSIVGSPDGDREGEYRTYLQEAPPRRPKPKGRRDDVEEFFCDYLGHIERICSNRLLGLPLTEAKIQLRTAVIWVAHHLYRIPASAIRAYYGYANDESVRALVSRIGTRLADLPVLRNCLESVYVYAARFR
jgi:REP element-mobilizing transposase RayT